MSILNKPYEISLWEDVWNGTKFEEQKYAVIGSDTMISQSRAFNPKFTRQINGNFTLTFSIYYQYADSTTGETVNNPFINAIENERRGKLKYDNKWYDFIIKDINIDKNKKTYDVTATSYFVNELSKNGYNWTFDPSVGKHRGTGTIKELTEEMLGVTTSDTEGQVGWKVKSDIIPQLTETYLYGTRIKKDINVKKITIRNDGQIVIDDNLTTIPSTSYVYVSKDCYDQSLNKCMLFYKNSGFNIDSDHFIIDKDCQYILNITTNYNDIFDNITDVNTEYRAKRLTYSSIKKYVPVLDKYITECIGPFDKKYYMVEETSYSTPDLIQELSTNGSNFNSTSGWTYGYIDGSVFKKHTSNELKIDSLNASNKSLYAQITSGATGIDINNYTPYLIASATSKTSCLLNSGIYDNRAWITDKKLNVGDQFKIIINGSNQTGAYFGYIGGKNGITKISDPSDNNGIIKITIPWDLNNKTQKLYLILPVGATGAKIKKISLFQYIKEDLTPDSTSTDVEITTKYYYYLADDVDKAVLESDLPSPITSLTKLSNYKERENYEKRRNITASASNYYNIIQTMCEKFECWADIQIGHDIDGKVNSKTIYYKNYIGQDNPVGFKYGVNLKSITRTQTSKELVTKLIVKNNSNQFAQNKFCTIARAPSNPIKDNVIYDFSYYIPSMMSYSTYVEQIQSYYNNIKDTNNSLNTINDRITALFNSLVAAEAKKTEAEVGYEKASELYRDAEVTLKDALQNPKLDWKKPGVDLTKINSNPTYSSYLQKIITYYGLMNQYSAEKTSTESRYNDLKRAYDGLVARQTELIDTKQKINNAFFKKFARFIQEGTWSSEDYYDDEKYFLDGRSVLASSCKPKVTYNISVLELSQLPGYENYSYDLGDQTFIEDPEFFGYSDIDNLIPKQTQITLTEIVNNLDDHSKDSIKVQTYKDQFESLFKRITATVQSIAQNKGALDNAATLAAADAEYKASFLKEGLNSASTILQNAGAQSVVWDKNGITVTEPTKSSNQLRIVAGGILLSDDGGESWKLGITSDGVSASIINAGVLNTNKIRIMNGDKPQFVWDFKGITAFDATLDENGNATSVNSLKGVRFDQFGIYGCDGIDMTTYQPESLEDISKKATFYLTWDGLKVSYNIENNGKTSTYGVFLGKHKVGQSLVPLSIGESSNPKFYVTHNGVLHATGAVINGSGTFTGIIHAGQGGEIGGWRIGENEITSGKVGLNSTAASTIFDDPIRIYAGTKVSQNYPFYVTDKGYLYASKGTIGGCEIDSDGNLKIKQANIKGSLQASSIVVKNKEGNIILSVGKENSSNVISGWSIETDKIASKNVGLYSGNEHTQSIDGSSIRIYAGGTTPTDAKFYVTNDGSVYSSKGKIGGWDIGTNGITSGKVGLSSAVASTTSVDPIRIYAGSKVNQNYPFYVTDSGYLYSNSGKIGNLILKNGSLYIPVSGETDINNSTFAISYQTNDNYNYYTIETSEIKGSRIAVKNMTESKIVEIPHNIFNEKILHTFIEDPAGTNKKAALKIKISEEWDPNNSPDTNVPYYLYYGSDKDSNNAIALQAGIETNNSKTSLYLISDYSTTIQGWKDKGKAPTLYSTNERDESPLYIKTIKQIKQGDNLDDYNRNIKILNIIPYFSIKKSDGMTQQKIGFSGEIPYSDGAAKKRLVFINGVLVENNKF